MIEFNDRVCPVVDKYEYLNRIKDYIEDSDYNDITLLEIMAIFNRFFEKEK
jgi:hypothetical protein